MRAFTRTALGIGTLAAALAWFSLGAAAAPPETTDYARTALAASDGRGEISLVWFPGPSRLGSAAYRIEEMRGSSVRTVVDRVIPGDAAYRSTLSENDFAFAQDVPKIIARAEAKSAKRAEQFLGLRVFSDFAFAQAAGFARRLHAEGSGPRRYRVLGLDAAGSPNGTVLESASVDPAVVAPALPATVEGMRAHVLASGVALTWNPPPAGRAVVAYVLERIVDGRPVALTAAPILTGTTWQPDSARFVDRAAALDADVTYAAAAVDTFGRRGPAGTVTVATYSAAALAPLSLTARATPLGTVLDWKPRANPHMAGYLVDRGTSTAGPFEILTPTPLDARTSSFTDANARPGTSYYYRLTAVAPRGDLGPPSAIATVSMTKGTQPQPVDDVRADAQRTRVVLSWRPAAGTVAGYDVERRDVDGQTFVRINPAPIAGTTYVDRIGPSDGRTVEYRVLTVGGDGQRATPSRPVRATTFDSSVPNPPALMRADAAGGVARLQFHAAKNSTAHLVVFRSATEGELGQAISAPLAASATAYTDESAPGGRTWYYRIVARSDAGAASTPSSAARLTIASRGIPVPGAPRLSYTRTPFPHVAIAFAKPPAGLATAVDVQTARGTWSPVARATPAETANDAHPHRGHASYRVVYVDPSGRRGAPSPAAAIDVP